MSDSSLPSPQTAARAAAPETGMAPTSPASLSAIIKRIEQTLDEETVAIGTDVRFDLKASNARKSRHLYQLTKAMKGVTDNAALAEHRDSIVKLREKLATNEATLLAHMNAVNEVATLLRNAIQRAEADGTYSASEFGTAR